MERPEPFNPSSVRQEWQTAPRRTAGKTIKFVKFHGISPIAALLTASIPVTVYAQAVSPRAFRSLRMEWVFCIIRFFGKSFVRIVFARYVVHFLQGKC